MFMLAASSSCASSLSFPPRDLSCICVCVCVVCTWWPSQSKAFQTPRDVDKANTDREYLVSFSVVKGKCDGANASVTLSTEPYDFASAYTANLRGGDSCIQKTELRFLWILCIWEIFKNVKLG